MLAHLAVSHEVQKNLSLAFDWHSIEKGRPVHPLFDCVDGAPLQQRVALNHLDRFDFAIGSDGRQQFHGAARTRIPGKTRIFWVFPANQLGLLDLPADACVL